MSWIKLEIANVDKAIIRNMMKTYKNFEEMYLDINFRTFSDDVKKILEKVNKLNIENEIEKYEKRNIRIISANDREYPKKLKKIAGYPLFLYVKGKNLDEFLLENRNIAVVGTRKMTVFGKSACSKIVSELKKYDVTIISGMALGIDTEGLIVAKEKNMKRIGIVGTGLDVIYPYENRHLWEEIGKEGILISEYPLGTKGTKWTFPSRNRIIAGLSEGILIGESYKSGGSLITAELGFSMNKEIFAIPGFINYPSFEGCNNLIRDNKAKLVTSGEDIAKEFLWDINNENSKKNKLREDEKIVFEVIDEIVSIDEMMKKIHENYNEGVYLHCNFNIKEFTISKILSVVMVLKLKGLITETGTGKFMRLV